MSAAPIQPTPGRWWQRKQVRGVALVLGFCGTWWAAAIGAAIWVFPK